MNYAREHHSLIVANEKLYAIGGWAEILHTFIWNIANLDLKNLAGEIFAIQSRNTIYKRMNGEKLEK